MKTRTGIFTAGLALAMILPTITSCKKGEGDPFLSLKSRKARVAGEWTIDNWVSELSYNNSYTSDGDTESASGTNTTTISGTSVSVAETYTETGWWGTDSYTANSTGNAVATMVFEKDGTFARKIEFKNVIQNYFVDGVVVYTVNYNRTLETNGTWNFLGGVEEDFKNKERIVLNVLEDKTSKNYTDSDGDSGSESDSKTYANGEYTEIWQVTTLKNKEMVITGTTKNTGSSTVTDVWSGFSYVDITSSSENGSINATLKQK